MTAATPKGIGGHQRAFRGRSDDWITPASLIERLGPFDLDPCACNPQPWPTATTSYAPPDDGLDHQWAGRVWLNPPYGPQLDDWLGRLATHQWGTALVFARTETRVFHRHVWPHASAVLFLNGRIHFHRPDGSRAKGNAGGPHVLIAYGKSDRERLHQHRDLGFVVDLNLSRSAA